MYLMHKNDIVAKMILYKNTPIGISDIYKPELMPVGMRGDIDFADKNIASWHSGRVIPNGRVNLHEIENALGTVSELSMHSLGVSLTDCYWYVNESDVHDYKWEDINFHDNGFISDLLLLKQHLLDHAHRSPDYTTNGVLEKAWFCNNRDAYLVKSGIMPGVINEPVLAANEVVASLIANRMGIDCVEYQKTIISDEIFCSCRCFTKKNEDIVTAQNIAEQLETYDNFKVRNYIRSIGFGEDLDKMAVFHILIHNHDAHLNNFALIMDADTRAYVRFAPLYDNGACLNWHNLDTGLNNMQPFETNLKDYAESIETMITLPKLSELEYIVREVYTDFGISIRQLEIALNELRHGYVIIEERMFELERSDKEFEIGE